MKTLENYTEALNQAKSLPTHINGQLAPHYNKFTECVGFKIIYSEDFSPVSIFEAAQIRSNSAQRFYTKDVVTYREDGSIRPKREWTKKLYFHKAWSRKDQEVTSVKFDIVGIKRQTTHLPAGVLIDNISFIID